MLTRFLSRLRRITPTTRPVQKVRPRGLTLEALEAREVPATVYALNDSNQLLRFDTATPNTITTTNVTGLGANERLQGIDFRPRTGQLYGVTFPAGSTGNQFASTYTINPLTGAATLVGTTAVAVTNGNDDTNTAGDIDFNPTVDAIRYVSGDGTVTANARINPTTGALVGNDTAVTPSTAVLIGAAYDRNTDRASAANIPTTLYVIDRNLGSLATLGAVNGGTGAASPNGGVLNYIGTGLGLTLDQMSEGGFDIVEDRNAPSALNNQGLGIAYAALTSSVDNLTRLYTINLTDGTATLVGLIGNGSTEVFDIAVVPDDVVVVGSGTGATGDVRVLDSNTGAIRSVVSNPFPGFQGGVRVASGDVNGDGVPDTIVAAVFAQGPVKVFDGVTGQQLPGTIGSFFAFVNFQGTVNVAAGDVDGDGYADVLVSADGVQGGHVKAFSGRTGLELVSFFAYPGASGTAADGFLGNLTVASADFDNDGRDEIVTVATNNGHVKVFSALFAGGVALTTGPTQFSSSTAPNIGSFFAFPGFTTGAVNIAAGDVTGDGFADIVVSAGAGALGGRTKVFNGRVNPNTPTNPTNPALSFLPLPATFAGGAAVALADANGDGLLDIRITPGVGAQAQLFTFDINGQALLAPVNTFTNFLGGSTVAGSRF